MPSPFAAAAFVAPIAILARTFALALALAATTN